MRGSLSTGAWTGSRVARGLAESLFNPALAPRGHLPRWRIVVVMSGLRKPTPGPLFARVKLLSWIELAIFAALIAFWLLPGFETETMIFGWAHGLGFVALCIVIWVACGKREAPYTLLAATLTPVGPVGSVIGIELIERRGWGVADSPQNVAESP